MEHERAVHNLAVECYLLGEMSADERDAFESHYFECAVCAEDLRAASQFVADAKDILAAGLVRAMPAGNAPERRPAWNWIGWLQPQFAAAAIAMLVVVAGVETFRTIPSLQRRLDEASTPRIVNPTVLPPQTRGEPTVLRTASGDTAVVLFDLPESPAAELEFVVKSADGHVVFRLPGKTSGREEQVTLSIPRLNLPAGTYTLVVQAAGSNGQSGPQLGQYLFEVKRAF
jgi:hypothetical protein